MSTISITKLYDLLSAKVGKETAENLTTFIENKIDHDLESKTQHLATKEDLASGLGKLDTKISETKSELMRWMFIFWAGQMTATIALIILYLKK
jgi:hypothetical protein